MMSDRPTLLMIIALLISVTFCLILISEVMVHRIEYEARFFHYAFIMDVVVCVI